MTAQYSDSRLTNLIAQGTGEILKGIRGVGLLLLPLVLSTRYVLMFWGLGLLAAVFGTLASTQSRKAATEQGKYRAALLWSGLAFLLVLLATPWFRPLFRFFS